MAYFCNIKSPQSTVYVPSIYEKNITAITTAALMKSTDWQYAWPSKLLGSNSDSAHRQQHLAGFTRVVYLVASSWWRSSDFARAYAAHRCLLSEPPRCTAVVRRRSSLFPAGLRTLRGGLLSPTVSEPRLARCRWAIPRAALVGPAQASRCSQRVSHRNEPVLFSATHCSLSILT